MTEPHTRIVDVYGISVARFSARCTCGWFQGGLSSDDDASWLWSLHYDEVYAKERAS